MTEHRRQSRVAARRRRQGFNRSRPAVAIWTASVIMGCLTGSPSSRAQEDAGRLAMRVHSFLPRKLDFAAKPSATLSLTLNKAATVRLVIADWDLDEVVSLEKALPAGKQELAWDGRFTKGKPHDGPYLFRVHARTGDGQQAVYDPGFAVGLSHLKIEKGAYNAKTGKITYVMPRLGMARVRVYSRNRILIATLKDWTPHLAATHELTWDGNDQSGHPVNTQHVNVIVNAYSLSESAFFITGTGRRKPPRSPAEQRAWTARPALRHKYHHARTPRERSRDPRLSLYLRDGGREIQPGKPVPFDRPLRVQVKAGEADTRHLIDERFEVCVFLDGTLLFEDEDGLLPFTFQLDPEGRAQGPHLLTVMVLTAADHAGTVSCVLNVGDDTGNEEKSGGDAGTKER